MVLFFKVFFFFFIGNLLLGGTISVLATDPMIDCPINPIINGTGGCENPNTTFFASRGITNSTVEDPDTEAFFKSQFTADQTFQGSNGTTGTGPTNATGNPSSPGSDIVETVQQFFEQNEFLVGVGEFFRFLSFINPFYTFDVMGNMFAAVGIPIEGAMMDAMKGIFFFLGMLAVVFVILKIDVI